MHRKLDLLAPAGYVVLRDYDGPPVRPADWLALTYLGARGEHETSFAPLATATGELDGRDFWAHGRPDRQGQWTANRAVAPTLARYVTEVGAGFGRVRVVKAAPGTLAEAMRRLQRGDCNRLNPDGSPWVVRSWLELDDSPDESVLILREDASDPATETRIRLHPGLQVVVDADRLWHTVWHPGPRTRYALVTSWESGPALDAWMRRAGARRGNPPARIPAQGAGEARPVRTADR
jgi:hypothetical protein